MRRNRHRATELLIASAVLAGMLLAACGDGDEGFLARRDTTVPAEAAGPADIPFNPTNPFDGAGGADPIELPDLPPEQRSPADPPPDVPFVVADPVAPGAPVDPSADPASTARAVRLAPFTVVDPASDGIAAFSLLVPNGWRVSGEVQWLPFWSRLAFMQTSVADPSTGLMIDWLPEQNFISFTPPAGFSVPVGGNYQGKAFVPPITDPVAFVEQFWMGDTLAHLQGAPVVSVQDVPAMANAVRATFPGDADAGSYRIRYQYDVGGTTWEQDIAFTLLWAGLGSPTGIVSWYVVGATSVAAPAGLIDEMAGLASTVIASRTTTLEWEANYRLVSQLFTQGIQQQMADTARLGELLAQYRAQSQALQQQVFDERQASLDERNQLFRETLGGVQGYVDPVNQVIVQLPLGWDTYWVNEQGEYLAVSDPLFDPNTMNDGTWQQLEPRA